MNATDIDQAHNMMMAAPDDDVARLRFYELLADSELFLLLSGEPDEDQIRPEIFDIEDGQYALVFDREIRLADFVGRAAPYAAIPGRGLAKMLTGQGIGLALNLEVASSAMLIPAAAVDWLVGTLSHRPQEKEARLSEINAPTGLPEDVLTGLGRKLAMMAGMARWAYLATATYDNGASGSVLVFVDAVSAAKDALANAVGEALRFSGIEAGVIDVIFLQSSDPMVAKLSKVGLRFDLPERAETAPVSAPGSDPEKPPRLR